MPNHALIAPDRKFRVIGVDTFDHPTEGDYLIGDFDSLEEAAAMADQLAGPMNPVYVYDDAGRLVHSTGTP